MINLSRAIALLSLFLCFVALASNAANSCIDINTAPKEELEKIKHIGESRAEQIIKLRQEKLFSSLDELGRVTGIGPARIADIKEEGLACALTEGPDQNSEKTNSLSIEQTNGQEEERASFKEEKSSVGGFVPEKQLASMEEQALNSENFLFTFLTALFLAVIFGLSLLFLKRKMTNGLE